MRSGHPEQREAGGGWGRQGPPGTATDTGGARYGDWVGAPRTATAFAPAQQPPTGLGGAVRVPGQRVGGTPHAGPRRDFVEAFEEPGTGPHTQPQEALAPHPDARKPHDAVTGPDDEAAVDDGRTAPGSSADRAARPRAERHRGRVATGLTAAAMTVALAAVVAGQQPDGGAQEAAAPSPGERKFAAESGASRNQDRPTPHGGTGEVAPAVPATYEHRMAQKLPMAPDQAGPNAFDTVPGEDQGPGKALVRKTYRVDVEKDVGLDGKFFAEAVQRTLNDKRSWAGDGDMAFDRRAGGKVDFVVTLATPVTTNAWCLKSGLETLSQNVSCDSAITERIMINGFRWAAGSPTFGDGRLFAYRQMLINHEVGHRLGYGHKSCTEDGALAPVMMQQTKTLDTGAKKCRPNPWVHPES
ncbi:DUF3152 domain-containing protein [Streptomyces candidus]|uniref:DUF3152 domain-containing protein n=1 Tax=Streptomyces candidus TaxID=67283 RepID=A0A7X0HH74_9ACTN|nr:DUF3152 domain-containing protein [Streptomyces candidus]MBB6437418.1 hypothetical protein [Streptomyces candidus]